MSGIFSQPCLTSGIDCVAGLCWLLPNWSVLYYNTSEEKLRLTTNGGSEGWSQRLSCLFQSLAFINLGGRTVPQAAKLTILHAQIQFLWATWALGWRERLHLGSATYSESQDSMYSHKFSGGQESFELGYIWKWITGKYSSCFISFLFGPNFAL